MSLRTLATSRAARMADKERDEPPMCENCFTVTRRSCSRCGQRICRVCAKDHKVADGNSEEFRKSCTPRPKREEPR